MRWLLQNAKDRLRRGLKSPGYAAARLVHHLIGSDERFLASVTDSAPAAIRKFIDEPSRQLDFMTHLKGCISALRETPDPICYLYAKKILIQYAVARAMRPEVIVETGVGNGISSSYWLLACHLNGKGRVYSIDIGNGEFLPPGKPTGWIVPGYLRSRWTLRLGDAWDVLPQLLAEAGELDIFVHDSCHSYEHMNFEFDQAYPRIRAGGLLMSDDVEFNSAYHDFICARGVRTHRIISGVGIMKKETAPEKPSRDDD
jgi:predicted O-methyltransferase YrrM